MSSDSMGRIGRSIYGDLDQGNAEADAASEAAQDDAFAVEPNAARPGESWDEFLARQDGETQSDDDEPPANDWVQKKSKGDLAEGAATETSEISSDSLLEAAEAFVESSSSPTREINAEDAALAAEALAGIELSPKQQLQVVSAAEQHVARALEAHTAAQRAQFEQEDAEWRRVIDARPDGQAVRERAEATLLEFGRDAELQGLLKDTGLGGHPGVVLMLSNIQLEIQKLRGLR
ncbi:MAG: hypothetical protein NXI30_04655 [bacterium]|nr:hypothetical protein [bacterium]